MVFHFVGRQNLMVGCVLWSSAAYLKATKKRKERERDQEQNTFLRALPSYLFPPTRPHLLKFSPPPQKPIKL
jgi:hypothetical protein